MALRKPLHLCVKGTVCDSGEAFVKTPLCSTTNQYTPLYLFKEAACSLAGIVYYMAQATAFLYVFYINVNICYSYCMLLL